VHDQLNRGTIISQLIVMMREIMYPATRSPKILHQMLDEKNQNLISTVTVALLGTRTTYLPTELVPQFNKEVANFFFAKAVKEEGNESLQIFCLEKALTFVIDKEGLEKAASWILADGKVTIDGKELSTPLNEDHKYQIIKSYFVSPHFTLEEKETLKAKTFATDTSDKALSV
jgi:hypothetical protein